MKRTSVFALLAIFGLLLSGILYYFVRQILTANEINAEWTTAPGFFPPLQATSSLEIIPLYEEASSNDGLVIGHGVSYLVKTDSSTILFDVGNNPDQLSIAPYYQNMSKLGIDWGEVDALVISHPHPDHIGGVEAWKNNTVSLGDLPRGIGDRLLFIPAKMNYKGAIHATIPTLPGQDVATTGVISYQESFPLSVFNPKGNEQALVINIKGQGLVVITGCGHPGLGKLVERAEKLYNTPVIGIAGGLHYENINVDGLEADIRLLKTNQIKLLALSPHDSSVDSMNTLASAFPSAYHTLRVGEAIKFP